VPFCIYKKLQRQLDHGKWKYFPFDHIHKHDLSSVYKEKVLAFAVGLGMTLIIMIASRVWK